MGNFIVIGAGILGASTAYHLAKAGDEVTIIDRNDLGQATDAAAGIICPWLSQRRNKAWYTLAKAGAAYYPGLIKQLEDEGERDTGYQLVGALSLHNDEGKLAKMKERAELRVVDAPEIGEIHLLSQTETTALFPLLSGEDSSVFVSGAARVDGRALSRTLIKAAQRHGAQLIVGSAELESTEGEVTGVIVDEKRLVADGIIITAGAWAPELLKPLGITLHIEPQKAQILHLQLEHAETAAWPVVMPPDNQYILAFEDGRIVAGSTHENNQPFDARVTAWGVHHILDKALKVAPGLAEASFAEARVGFRPVAPNFLPVIGRIPGYRNVLLANGLGSSGLTVGPFLGQQLAKLASEQQLDIDLDLYNLTEVISEIIS